MMARRTILTSIIIICALLMFVSINVSFIGYILVLSWTSYRLLFKRDFTLLQTSMFQHASLKLPDFEKLSQDETLKYQRIAYRVGWWVLPCTIGFLIALISLNV